LRVRSKGFVFVGSAAASAGSLVPKESNDEVEVRARGGPEYRLNLAIAGRGSCACETWQPWAMVETVLVLDTL